mgnify:CR=1 FL=1
MLWDDCGSNEALYYEGGNGEAVERAFTEAAHVVRQRLVINRISAIPMEPRGAIGVYDPGTERYTLHAGHQRPFLFRRNITESILGIPETRLRIVTGDIGGSFGQRGSIFPELALVLWAAKRVGRPVKWICERTEGFLSDDHARDNVTEAALALDEGGRFLALRAKTDANLGAFMRLDPSVGNLYDDGYTALEVWIEASSGQTELALNDNLAAWAGLLNQGIFKAGLANSDTHSKVVVQAGGPRTYVASSTDDPAGIDPAALVLAVNAGRAVGAGGVFMRVNLEGDGGAQASHSLASPLTVNATSGNGVVNVHLESPTWAEFDTVDIYMNSDPDCGFSFTFDSVLARKCDVEPQLSLQKGVDFNVTTQPGVSGAGQRLVADISQSVSLAGDTWVIVVARGTDGVSSPLFPMNPQNLEAASNTNLVAITDYGTALPWNLGQGGSLAAAFSNPLFFDAQGDGLCHGGTVCP